MSTYTGNFTTWQKMFPKATSEIPLDKLGVGLQTLNTDTKKPYTNQELQERFKIISQHAIQELDVWVMPIPDNWWSFLDTFVN